MKIFIKIIILSTIVLPCLANEKDGNDFIQYMKLWSSEVKPTTEDTKFYGLGECRVFLKKGTTLTNDGSLVRVDVDGGKMIELRKVVDGNKSFNDMINRLSSEKADWFPFHRETIVILEDTVITMISRKGGLIELISKKGGYPFLVLEKSQASKE
jgi:hypothetical protein